MLGWGTRPFSVPGLEWGTPRLSLTSHRDGGAPPFPPSCSGAAGGVAVRNPLHSSPPSHLIFLSPFWTFSSSF